MLNVIQRSFTNLGCLWFCCASGWKILALLKPRRSRCSSTGSIGSTTSVTASSLSTSSGTNVITAAFFPYLLLNIKVEKNLDGYVSTPFFI